MFSSLKVRVLKFPAPELQSVSSIQPLAMLRVMVVENVIAMTFGDDDDNAIMIMFYFASLFRSLSRHHPQPSSLAPLRHSVQVRNLFSIFFGPIIK